MSEQHETATTENLSPAIISREFTDPISNRVCTLHVAPAEDFWLAAKVQHPDCTGLADVSADLDCFYCQVCRWNGRVSGAWVVDLWERNQEADRG